MPILYHNIYLYLFGVCVISGKDSPSLDISFMYNYYYVYHSIKL